MICAHVRSYEEVGQHYGLPQERIRALVRICNTEHANAEATEATLQLPNEFEADLDSDGESQVKASTKRKAERKMQKQAKKEKKEKKARRKEEKRI